MSLGYSEKIESIYAVWESCRSSDFKTLRATVQADTNVSNDLRTWWEKRDAQQVWAQFRALHPIDSTTPMDQLNKRAWQLAALLLGLTDGQRTRDLSNHKDAIENNTANQVVGGKLVLQSLLRAIRGDNRVKNRKHLALFILSVFWQLRLVRNNGVHSKEKNSYTCGESQLPEMVVRYLTCTMHSTRWPLRSAPTTGNRSSEIY